MANKIHWKINRKDTPTLQCVLYDYQILLYIMLLRAYAIMPLYEFGYCYIKLG